MPRKKKQTIQLADDQSDEMDVSANFIPDPVNKRELARFQRWYDDCEMLRKKRDIAKYEYDEAKKKYKEIKDTLEGLREMGPVQYASDKPMYDLFDDVEV